MNQTECSDVLCLKREKFRVSIRNQRLSQEFQKKRRTYNIQQKKNEFLERINQELSIYVTKEQLYKEEQNNIKLLLEVILKVLEDDNEIDLEFAHNLVKKFKFFVVISKIDQEFLEYTCKIIQQIFFHIDQKDFQTFNEFDDPFLLDYFDNILRQKFFDIFPSALHCIVCLMKEKQIYRDFIINNDFEIIVYLAQLDRFRQFSEFILGIILEAVLHSVGIDLEKFQPIQEYVMNSYYDENVGIRRMVTEIIREVISKIPDQQDQQFADQFIVTPVFRKIFDDANKTNCDFSSQSIVLQCFSLCSSLNAEQIQFFEKILQQKLQEFEANSHIRVQLYWAISNKVSSRVYLNQIMHIVACIIQNYQDGPIMIQNELSYVILNLTRSGNQEQLSHLVKIGLVDACDFLFTLGESQIQQNILISLTWLLKKFEQNLDINNELIMSFQEIKQRIIEKHQLVQRVMDSKCDSKLINDFDVYF